MPNPTSIHLYLADGTADGLWVVTKDNWAGVALVIPKSIYTRVRSTRNELTRAGTYVLIAASETNPERDRIYVGESEVLRQRLDNHYANKDWTRVIVFTTNDGSLNKAHAKYLESRLIALAGDANRADIENDKPSQRPGLPEAETSRIEAFLADMLMIYPAVGVRAFEALAASIPGEQRLYLKGPGASAEGKEAPDGFVVLAGSMARVKAVPAFLKYQNELRETLVQDGVIQPTPEGLRFVRDHLFNSPSTAAAVVLARNANGRIAWKDENGKTLKEIQTEAVAN